MEILGSALQVGYELMYGQKFSGDRKTLLQGLPKRNLVYELAGLNNMLKSAIEKEFKIDPEEQMKILMYFCNGNYNASLPYRQRLQLIYNYLQQKPGGGMPVLFSRATILVCLNEILAETELDVDDSYGWTIEARKKFLDYFLCVTDLVSSYQVQDDSDKFRPIENLAAGSGFLNELNVVNDPFFTVYRFVCLSEFMESDDALSSSFDQHFKNMNIEHLNFARHVMSMCMFSKTTDHDNRLAESNVVSNAVGFCIEIKRS
ncbi:hypothetical protein [Pseudochryseolinea flava]|uniref:Uncharacterized protein n=1 Tax=Pseudochryseolinea flava TaxID=2059302 RepID=A0A364Y6J8_9BACT|nr:hypothetical protein [Pseudochryseolinea flava]RAW02597.1 hypothetical protein DQQ10_00325 [Pseudochryseolinea flava]